MKSAKSPPRTVGSRSVEQPSGCLARRAGPTAPGAAGTARGGRSAPGRESSGHRGWSRPLRRSTGCHRASGTVLDQRGRAVPPRAQSHRDTVPAGRADPTCGSSIQSASRWDGRSARPCIRGGGSRRTPECPGGPAAVDLRKSANTAGQRSRPARRSRPAPTSPCHPDPRPSTRSESRSWCWFR